MSFDVSINHLCRQIWAQKQSVVTDEQETNPYQREERSTGRETKDGTDGSKDVGQEIAATSEGQSYSMPERNSS